MKRAYRLWTCDASIWTKWMRERYIKGKGLYDINKRPNIDSTLWVGLLDDRGEFMNHMSCNPNYVFQWNGFGSDFSFKNAVETVWEKKDNLAEGIWSNKIGKHAMMLWRTRWKESRCNMRQQEDQDLSKRIQTVYYVTDP